jgi:L-ascorbate metabolism protein UlaG (beta-lactamase superfamily)
MRITKYGHACVEVEVNGVQILIDPGSYSEMPDSENLDAILITHEHADHLALPQLKKLIENNTKAQVITHEEVGKLLTKEGVSYTEIEDGEEVFVKGVSVRSYGAKHAIMYEGVPICRNTGFMIANRFFYPGDSFYIPDTTVEILGLPVNAPWMKLSECIDYAKKVNPKVVIPLHDGMLRSECLGSSRQFPMMVLLPLGIEFRDMTEGSVENFN